LSHQGTPRQVRSRVKSSRGGLSHQETPPRENGLGFGHLPLIGAGEVIFPARDDLEEQLTAFLRDRAPTFNVSLPRLEGMWGEQETFTTPPPPWAPCASGPATGGPLFPQPQGRPPMLQVSDFHIGTPYLLVAGLDF
jgi:hypothetical protein